MSIIVVSDELFQCFNYGVSDGIVGFEGQWGGHPLDACIATHRRVWRHET